MAKDKDVLTTGDVARLCRVTIRTVIKWFEQGRLQGYRLPGSGDRRFPRAAVERFLAESEIPVEWLEQEDGGGPRRVLIVDDDGAVREMLSRFLGRIPGLQVETAGSGWEAGLKTASLRPHLLLLDYRLGDTTGDKVLATIRNHEGLSFQPAIVIMSAYLTEEEVRRILEQGADAYLPKPFDLDALRLTVLQHLDLPA